ncbi:unnamed protein product, partial [Scytosiphon promiscuus]
ISRANVARSDEFPPLVGIYPQQARSTRLNASSLSVPLLFPLILSVDTPKNQAELAEEEDSSLFFVQLPTKLPRPLPAFQRGRDGGSQSSGGGKGKGKAS